MNRSQAGSEPRVAFFVGHPPAPVSAGDRQWNRPLPLDRANLGSTSPAGQAAVTYGDYFTAVSHYLSQDQMAVARRMVAKAPDRASASHGIDTIRIHLIKHGALYHPAMITLVAGAAGIPMVVNVAVSQEGRERIAAETEHLDHLNRLFADRYVPEVYHYGTGRTGSGVELPMFAGEWFSQYHELHLTRCNRSGAVRHLVWDPEQKPWHLSEAQSADFYRQAMFILTCYFDPHTLSVIQQWHHAAGDFVIKSMPEGIDLRLITVRRYAPLLHLEGDEHVTLETLLEALSLFLLRTSLWMRIDRIDGVGELVWAGDAALPSMWAGFGQGLEKMARIQGFPHAFVEGTRQYLASYTLDDLIDLGLRMLARYPQALPEAPLLKRHMERHAQHLHQLMRKSA